MAASFRILAAALTLALAVGVSACGNKQSPKTVGLTEGAYLDIGPMSYQVQISRQLNPRDTEDKAYLEGVGLRDRAIKNTEVWFAVFLRVQNQSSQPQVAANAFEITDTQDDRYEPLPLALTNQWAYRGGLVAPGGGPPATDNGFIPTPNSPPANGVVQGSLLLFKLPLTALNNRPLELRIRSAQGEARVDLDI